MGAKNILQVGIYLFFQNFILFYKIKSYIRKNCGIFSLCKKIEKKIEKKNFNTHLSQVIFTLPPILKVPNLKTLFRLLDIHSNAWYGKLIISRALGYARAGWVIYPPIFGRTKQIENNCLLDFLSLLFAHSQRSVSSIGIINNLHSHM